MKLPDEPQTEHSDRELALSPLNNDLKQKHTKVTDEILKIIDTGDPNRYAVALRLTAWATHSNNAARLDELQLAIQQFLFGNENFTKYADARVRHLENKLEATEGRSEPDSVGTTDVSQATNALLDRLKEGMGERKSVLPTQWENFEEGYNVAHKLFSDLLDKERKPVKTYVKEKSV